MIGGDTIKSHLKGTVEKHRALQVIVLIVQIILILMVVVTFGLVSDNNNRLRKLAGENK